MDRRLRRRSHFPNLCLNRFIYVKKVESLKQVIDGMENMHGKVSTMALAAMPIEAEAMIEVLGQWGVSRVCSLEPCKPHLWLAP